MANQVKLPEMTEEVESYFRWLNKKSGLEEWNLGQILYETDFRWNVDDDKNRAEDGLKWRDRYAEDVGGKLGKVQQNYIRRSIHGKASCYEVILSLADEINAMVNEEEESRTPEFFKILIGNLGLVGYDDEDFDYRGDAVKAKVEQILAKWMDCEADFCDSFTLFPVTVLKKCDKKVSQWMQMNRWLEENSDENGAFVTEKCHSVTVSKQKCHS